MFPPPVAPPAVRRFRIPSLLAAIAVAAALGPAPVAATAPGGSAIRWDVALDSSSLETVLLDPESILADPEAFWANDAAYALARRWHDNNAIPLEQDGYYGRWLEAMRGFAAVPSDARRDADAFRILESMRGRERTFLTDSLALLSDYLPRNGIRVPTTIHVTTGTRSCGFMTNGMIVVDALSDHYGGDPDLIFNMLTHETFHVAYGYDRSLRTEDPLDDAFVYDTMLDALQNEGLATYVGYKARAVFPATAEPDYLLLENPAEVRDRIAAVNRLFAMVGTVPPDSLRRTAWNVGVTDRAYYIAGAHMARTIEEARGRDALIATIETGPLGFVDAYDEVAPAGLSIATFPAPPSDGLLLRLKHAALDGDDDAFAAAAAGMQACAADLHPQTRRRLERFGYGLLRMDAYDRAISVFELDVALFPEEPNSYDSLAEAYLRSGDRENAVRYYRQALDVDPEFANARRMLAEIE